MVSRLRRTHIFKKRHSPPSVSSTPNAYSKNQVSSRLRQMLLVLKKWRLVSTKRILHEQSRGERGWAGPHIRLAICFELFDVYFVCLVVFLWNLRFWYYVIVFVYSTYQILNFATTVKQHHFILESDHGCFGRCHIYIYIYIYAI